MNRKFLPGERVRVYNGRHDFIGTIDSIIEGGSLFVIEDGFYSAHNDAPFHPKQCRRLVKKKRREWWVNIYPHFTSHCYETKAAADSEATSTRQECIRVREVKTKEKK